VVAAYRRRRTGAGAAVEAARYSARRHRSRAPSKPKSASSPSSWPSFGMGPRLSDGVLRTSPGSTLSFPLVIAYATTYGLFKGASRVRLSTAAPFGMADATTHRVCMAARARICALWRQQQD